jgi:hypothetical protein
MQSAKQFVQEKEMENCAGHGDVQVVRQTSLQKLAAEESAVAAQLEDEAAEWSFKVAQENEKRAQLLLDASKSRCRTPEMEDACSDPAGSASPEGSPQWVRPAQTSEEEELDGLIFSMSRADFYDAERKTKAREDKVALKEAGGGAQMWLTMRVKRGDANAQHATGLFPFLPQRSLACQHRTCQHHTLGMSLHATRTHLREPLCALQQVLAIWRWWRKYLKRNVRVAVEIEIE